MSFTTIDLFAGIGGIRLGFEAHNCKNVKDAQKMYHANFEAIAGGNDKNVANTKGCSIITSSI